MRHGRCMGKIVLFEVLSELGYSEVVLIGRRRDRSFCRQSEFSFVW